MAMSSWMVFLSRPMSSSPALSSTSPCRASSCRCSSVIVAKVFRISLIFCSTILLRDQGSVSASNFNRNSGSCNPLVKTDIHDRYPDLPSRIPKNHCRCLASEPASHFHPAQPAEKLRMPRLLLARNFCLVSLIERLHLPPSVQRSLSFLATSLKNRFVSSSTVGVLHILSTQLGVNLRVHSSRSRSGSLFSTLTTSFACSGDVQIRKLPVSSSARLRKATSVMGLAGFEDGADGTSVVLVSFVCFFEESSETAKGIMSSMIEARAVELVHQLSADGPKAKYLCS
jgi:hypothetical protein